MIESITVPETATPAQRAAIVTAVMAYHTEATAEPPTDSTSSWKHAARLEATKGVSVPKDVETTDRWMLAARLEELQV